jgi:serine/threonine protein kinase
MAVEKSPVLPKDLVLPSRYEFTGEVLKNAPTPGRVFVGALRDASTGAELVVKAQEDDPDTTIGLRTEANVLESLAHPNIPRLHRAGLDTDLPWIVTDRMPGSSETCEWFNARPNPILAAKIVLSALDPLGYLHDEKGLQHNDVKEANLVCQPDGRATALIDFEYSASIGQPAGDSDETPCTPHYLAPERVGEPGDARSDLYSLNVLLYTYLYGKLPYGHITDTMKVVMAHLFHPIPFFPDTHISGRQVPTFLRGVVEKGLQKSPEDRYQSAGEMADDIQRWLGDKSIAAEAA